MGEFRETQYVCRQGEVFGPHLPLVAEQNEQRLFPAVLQQTKAIVSCM